VLTTLVILFACGTHSPAASTRPKDVNLVGIPGPYSFDNFCRLATDELWAVGGKGTVHYTNRSGTVERHFTDEDLNGVYFTNSSIGWVVGDEGSIWHTRDQGHSWSRQKSGLKQALKGIKCASESRCWAVGKNGVVLRTDDAGERWENKRAAASDDLYAVEFIDQLTGWVAGENGLLLHTDNGGDSWETLHAKITVLPNGPFAKPTNLVTVRFLNRDVGWVAGSGGVARTENGGKTWEVEEIEDSYFIGLVARDADTVWAVDSEGENYVTKDGGRTWEPTEEKILVKRQPKKLNQLSSMAIRRRRTH
jgi:photosystem II stability/assembly factor-like uncharacterized protein